MRYVIFQGGSLNYAISLQQIQKILQGSLGYILPRLPGAVSAVIVDDGKLIPLLDLGRMFGEKHQEVLASQNYQVLVNSEYGTVALSADSTPRIISEQKGTLSKGNANERIWGTVAKFVYLSEEYNVLDINFLAIEMTQGFWQSHSDSGGAGRHQ
jgi:chemotaxis signal transduction protein